jgi:hypothetical protein
MPLDRARRLPPRRIAALGLVAALPMAWAITAPVDALIARQEAVLLGRYTVGHFAGLAIATLVVGLVVSLLWSARSLVESVVLIGMFALSTSLGVVLVAGFAKEVASPRYVATPVGRAVADPALRSRLAGRVLVRQPNYRWEVLREDVPAPGRSYPDRVAGLPARKVVLTTDDRGLRNAPREPVYDVVVTGDSFTEGSMVSDDETWWRRLAAATGLRIYNVAVSGLTIREYLNHWAAFGLDTGARTVVALIYEGNDWKVLSPAKPVAAARPSPLRAGVFDLAFGDAPLRWRTERALIQLLAPIGAGWPPPPSVGLSWMPVRVEAGGTVRHYAFEPKHLMRLDWDPAAFAAAPEWTTNEVVLREMAALARERGVRLVVAYAPSKPHVVLPLVSDQVSAEQLHAFAAFRDRGPALPDPATLRDRLLARLDAQEGTLADWCAATGIEFVSLTAPLREAMAQGVPVYFTYDPHWSEQGHAVAARHLATHFPPSE